MTLKGKDIVQVAASDKKVFALSRKGELYVLSSAKKYQQLSEEEKVQGWSDYFWGIYPSVKFFKADIPNPSNGEKIKNISAGQHHLAALTSDNRILTLQADATGKTYGQLGIGNLDSAPIPSNSDENAADYCLQFAEAKLPDSVTLDKVSCGNNHTFIRTDSGRIFAFGANFLGQLGLGHFTMSKAVALTPQEITDKFSSTNQQVRPKIVDVVAGGDTSAFVVQQVDFDDNVKSVELYTCGFGQWGQLGNNRYMHVQGMPVKVPSFSCKFEYSEELNRVVPVNLYKVSIGATHLFATLDNVNVKSDFGRDVYAWYVFVFQPSNFSRGENLDFQLGTGKRSNLNAPAPPLLPNYRNSSGSQESDLQSALQGRLQVASPATVSVALPGKKGKQNLQVEQEIVAGFGVSAIYSKIIL
ncbi:hypothetical protein DSO57_1036575 [Entomophthora muscae]|uniref:Uncharacterized protein n=1 Tax=Entomophthora muscae TaxID=34485 RepID=A0ACC2SZI7_9FUNG|nr:hypothetical protein DSO57_1036575 [Entomophthora muscae]